ncbi:VIT family protein [Chitinophaga sp. CF118]|uniref:VIT1/CCC1 transporter family protein n=1 Tax=Chitinophaga sp. CF118 TaxID=1884367 RepID=UPI0008EDB48C|nr:VIT1/CCC1 transporter family protein [Chitinophaga sp. CF118]SFE53539.1 VIT family protein [Chitinophaga sp. CF118]
MSKEHKAIRSSGWITDFLIGFPEGLLVLFFTTYLSHGLNITVQKFYTVNDCIWLIGSILVMITAYQANKGDSQHDESTLSANERKKLESLDIGENVIENIAEEMARDATDWENTLQQENVQVSNYHMGRALANALVTGIFFLLGGLLPFWPYLQNENFPEASRISILFCFIIMTLFSFVKSRITRQEAIPMILRNILYTGAVFLGAYMMQMIFK